MLHLDFGTDNVLYRRWFSAIEKYQLSFEIIGMSYYPYWNGKLELLEQNMADISRRFGKDVLVAETAIGYTADSLGCHGMVYSQELADKTDYPPTKQGQQYFLRDLTRAIRNVPDDRGKGFLYWEPEWLPFPQFAWAKPAGCKYTNDKGVLGNSWANQALFDEQGNANPALENLNEMRLSIPLIVSNFAFNFNNFSNIFMITGGGPARVGSQFAGSTDILASTIYKMTTQSNRYELSATLSVISFMIVGTLTLINLNLSGAFKEVD